MATFRDNCQVFFDKGLIPIPLGSSKSGQKAKGAYIVGWEKFARHPYSQETLDQWKVEYANRNIGLCMGSKVGEYQLIGIDIDHDDFLEKVQRTIPRLVSGKVGSKGATWFVLAPLDFPTKAFKVKGPDNKRRTIVDILSFNSQTVIPPSWSEKAGKEYQWLGQPLHEVELDTLPLINEGTLIEIQEVVQGKDHYFNGGIVHEGTPNEMEIAGINHMTWLGPDGGGDTHDERVRAAAHMIATGWQDTWVIERLDRAMREALDRAGGEPPMNWDIVERDHNKMVEGAIKKGYAENSSSGTRRKKKVPTERLMSRWAQSHFYPLKYFGGKFISYKEGHWPSIEPEIIKRAILNVDDYVGYSEMETSIKTLAVDCWVDKFGDESSGLICVKNGTLEIDTMEIRPWSEDDELMHQLDVPWDPDAQCPIYDEFILRAFDGCTDSVRTFEEFAGLTLIDEMKFHKALFIIGPGQTGKSTLATILESMHAENAVGNVPITELDNERVRTSLVGKMVNISSEQSRMNAVSDIQFKQITGGDRVPVRRLYQELENNVRLKVRFVSVANDLPATNDVSSAMRRRMIILKTPKSVEESKKDPYLIDKIRKERAGILRKWVEALRTLLDRGAFDPPAKSEELVAEYLLENNAVHLWMKARTQEIDPKVPVEGWTDSSELYSDFREWAVQNGFYRPVVLPTFIRTLGHLHLEPTELNLPFGRKMMFRLKLNSLIPNVRDSELRI